MGRRWEERCLAPGPRSARRAMNVHHLELFYYVARSGGISAAVRHIPYGIQQPAVSGQMRLLEDDLKVKLFERQPFRLTSAGSELYAFVAPFFENVDKVCGGLSKRATVQIRIGGSETVLRQHLPPVIQRVKQKFRDLRLAIRNGVQSQLEPMLR